MTDGTTLLFGLPGVEVERVDRLTDGTRVVQVVTAEPAAAACPGCGVVAPHLDWIAHTAPAAIWLYP